MPSLHHRRGRRAGCSRAQCRAPCPPACPGSLLPGSSPGPTHLAQGSLCGLSGGAAARLLAGCEWAGKAVGFLFSRGIKPQP